MNLDAAAETDGNAGEARGFIFLHQVLDFGEVPLAVGALGAEVVDEQRTVAEMAEQNAPIVDAHQGLGKVHLHGGVGGGILHELDVCHLGFGGELCKTKSGSQGHESEKAFEHWL